MRGLDTGVTGHHHLDTENEDRTAEGKLRSREKSVADIAFELLEPTVPEKDWPLHFPIT